MSPRTRLNSVPSLASSRAGYASPFRSQATPGRRMQGMSLDGRSWAESLALPPCAQLGRKGVRAYADVRAGAVATRESDAQKTSLQTQIEEIIALNPVVVFSKTTCPFCAQAKMTWYRSRSVFIRPTKKHWKTG